MTFLKRLLSSLLVLAVAACGGGGSNSGTPPFGGGGGGGSTPTVSDIVVVLASDTVANSSTSAVRVTATALDANRNALAGVPMTLGADANAVLTVVSNATTTDASGKLLADVGVGSDRTNRVITITATSGSVVRTATLTVVTSPESATPATIELIASSTTVGTGGDQVGIQAFVKDATNNALAGANVTFATNTGTLSSASTSTSTSGVATANFAAGSDKSNRSATITVTSGTVQAQLTLPITGTKLTASGPTSLILGNTGPFTVQVVDSKGNVLPGVAVSASSTLGNPISAPAGSITDSNGQAAFTYAANNSGSDQLVFAAANFTAPALVISISGDDFRFESPAASTKVPVGVLQTVQVRLRQGGVPVANKPIAFTTTGGTLTAQTANTDASGLASVQLSSNSAGPVTVQATVQDATAATATLPLNIVATTPSKLVLQVSPTALAPNPAGSTTSQARVIAKVTDTAGNPVQGLTVNFSRDLDPSGGNMLQPSAVTDLNGQASVPYSAGPESTANNGVVLRGTVATAAAVTGTATLTVNQTALFITLGTGNTIGNIDNQTYRKDWVVYVTDANGVAVSGVTLAMKVLPLHYLRGNLAVDASGFWVYNLPVRVCRNEDANSNGILDPGEDYNNDGVLWPGNVVSVSPGSVQTDSTGRATVSLIYAESFAPWVNVRLTASATVAGTESRRDAEFIVTGSAPDFSTAGPPAGTISPFGLYSLVSADAALCADYPTLP